VLGLQSRIAVSWSAPLSDGGCPVTSYHLYLRSIGEESWLEIDADQVNDRAYLRDYKIDMSSYSHGLNYQVKVSADNVVGSTESDTKVFLLADVPSKPAPPTRLSNGEKLTILMSEPESDGGSQIIGYEL